MPHAKPPHRYSGAWQKKTLRHLLSESDEFVHIVELVTSRGVIAEKDGQRVLADARRLCEHPQMHAMSITDNPGGNAMINAETLGADLLSRGEEVIIHLSCKDWNRNALQGRAWQLASEGFGNVLCLSGDYPTSGYQGRAGGVFDIDSVGLLKMFQDLNAGLVVPSGKKSAVYKRPTSYSGPPPTTTSATSARSCRSILSWHRRSSAAPTSSSIRLATTRANKMNYSNTWPYTSSTLPSSPTSLCSALP